MPGGVVGVLTYYIPAKGSTLAVMWSVDRYGPAFGNWWNVKLFNGKRRPNVFMHLELYYNGNPFKAGSWHTKNLGGGLKCRGFMTTPANAKLKIKVSTV